ncbi:glycosyltransferase family 39 protein [Pannus brasiliensis CCIBt3594]|uniref:Glycosyltransferase family 39 protein n=1 Tax=Pannus brasiliensis CCIBt3594 TaxID=1427578 RepID=A0AAW9QUK9_9CHRO
MNRQTFTWGHPGYKLRQREDFQEILSLVGLLFGALLLYTVGLGNLPLRDWDEGTIGRVAIEISRSGLDSFRWLFPTLWDDPYLNKPPLIHSLIAVLYHFFGVHEWTTRLPSAFLSALSVPLLYLLGREIFPGRSSALLSALVYLTLLPVVRHGRLAMLDGGVLCFEILMILGILRSRRDLRWSLGAGLGFSLLCLTKGIMGLLLAAIGFLFLLWDTPRLLTSAYFWLGWFLGATPAIAWYVAQFLHYDREFLDSLLAQQLKRVGASLDNHRQPFWYYLLEILKYSLPWLMFSIWGFRLARLDYRYSWAKLLIVWGGVYLVAVSLMSTKLPWYILPIYPVLALAAGHALDRVRNFPIDRPYSPIWGFLLGAIAVIAGGAGLAIYLDWPLDLLPPIDPLAPLTLAALSLTTATAALLVARRSEQFIPVLLWGMYVSLFIFVSSPYWIWELNEAFPVKPVAGLIQKYVPADRPVYMAFEYERPSLNFYSDRRVFPLSEPALLDHWRETPHPYLLVDRPTRKRPEYERARVLGKTDKISGNAGSEWFLITK